MWPFKPRPTRSSARPVDCQYARPPQSARPPVRPTRRPRNAGPDRLVHPSARPLVRSSARPPVRACWALSAPRGPRPPLFSTVRTLSAPVRPTVRGLSAPSARPLIRQTASSTPVRPSALALIVCHVCPPPPVRHVRSARARQPPLYIPHPASPQIIQLLAVRVGPRVSVAPLRTAALRGAQGLREVGMNCGGNPCNFFFTQQAAWRGRPFTSRETGL